MAETLLKTDDLTIGYAQKTKIKTVAQHVNVTLRAGKFITLIGTNGVGKSTFLKTITKINKPLNGHVLLGDKDLQSFTQQELATQISVVLTEKLPPSNLSVYELVALGRQPYTNWLGNLAPQDHQKVLQALQLTELEYLQNRKHYEISDGQLQKVLIARALAQDTPLIILDEPTTHLDLVHKVSVYKLLKQLAQKTQKCILMSTHDMDLSLQLSDEIIVFTKEKIHQNTPEILIKEGVFETLFKHQDIYFDAEKGKFIIK